MFRNKCINLYHHLLRFRMLSHVPGPAIQKTINLASKTTAFHHPINNSPYRCYCLESSNETTYTDPSSLISQEYEVKESIDDSSSTADAKIKRTNYKERCILKIKKAFKCGDNESSTLFRLFPNLFQENIIETMKKVEMLTKSGISEKSIFKNVDILEFSDDELSSKLKQLNKLGFNEEQKNDVLALMKLESHVFTLMMAQFRLEAKHIPEGNRLLYLSRILECPLEEVVDLSMKHEHLVSYPFERIKETFEYLLDNGISPRSIRNNPVCAVHQIEKIKKWINARKDKLGSCRTIDRANVIYFQNLIKRDKNDRVFLKPNQRREEFLAEKLQVDIKMIEYLMFTFPKTFYQDLGNLTKVIDFLYSLGYTGEQICANSPILNRKIESIQNRLDQCRSVGCDIIPLSMLCTTKTKFESYLKNWTSVPS